MDWLTVHDPCEPKHESGELLVLIEGSQEHTTHLLSDHEHCGRDEFSEIVAPSRPLQLNALLELTFAAQVRE
jgi:hypothetical protein